MTENCPNCDYSLHGLPDQHRCPECAFAFSRDAEVIRCGNRIPIFLSCMYGILLLFYVTDAVNEGVSDVWGVLTIAGFGATLLVSLLFLKRRRRAVFGEVGFELIGWNAPVRIFAWCDVERVEYAEFLGNARIVKANGEERVVIESDFFGSDKKVRTFVSSANDWLARYRGESEGADDPKA